MGRSRGSKGLQSVSRVEVLNKNFWVNWSLSLSLFHRKLGPSYLFSSDVFSSDVLVLLRHSFGGTLWWNLTNCFNDSRLVTEPDNMSVEIFLFLRQYLICVSFDFPDLFIEREGVKKKDTSYSSFISTSFPPPVDETRTNSQKSTSLYVSLLWSFPSTRVRRQ